MLHLSPGEDRWKRLIFESPGTLMIQCMNGETDNVTLEFNPNKDTMRLSDKDWDPNWTAKLTLENPGPQLLRVKGTVNGVEMSAKLHRIPESEFPLTKSRFRFTTD